MDTASPLDLFTPSQADIEPENKPYGKNISSTSAFWFYGSLEGCKHWQRSPLAMYPKSYKLSIETLFFRAKTRGGGGR